MSMRPDNVTIKDVARQAGVSVALVSRAERAPQRHAGDARAHPESIARELRYMPHGAARSLITRRTQTIGALLPDLYGEFFSELIRGMDLAARRGGCTCSCRARTVRPAETAGALRAAGRVDAARVAMPSARLLADMPSAVPTAAERTSTATTPHSASTTMPVPMRWSEPLVTRLPAHRAGWPAGVELRRSSAAAVRAGAGRPARPGTPRSSSTATSPKPEAIAPREIAGMHERADAIFAANERDGRRLLVRLTSSACACRRTSRSSASTTSPWRYTTTAADHGTRAHRRSRATPPRAP